MQAQYEQLLGRHQDLEVDLEEVVRAHGELLAQNQQLVNQLQNEVTPQSHASTFLSKGKRKVEMYTRVQLMENQRIPLGSWPPRLTLIRTSGT